MTIPAASQDLLGKTVGDMVEPGMYVQGDGSVFGTFKHVTGYEEFNSTVPEEQEGYFFPFELKQTGSKMTFKKNGVITKNEIAFDKDIVFRVTKGDTFEVLLDGKHVVTFNFRNARFKPE